MTIAQIIAQLIQLGIAIFEGVLKAQEIAARDDLTDDEKEALLMADLAAIQTRLDAVKGVYRAP